MIKLFAILVILTAFIISCQKAPENPVASFDVSKNSVEKSEEIYITNNSTNAQKYMWDFGDGTSSAEINPTISYRSSGLYTITCTASDRKGKLSSTTTRNVTVKTSKFIGTYAVSENYDGDECSSNSMTYNLVIREGETANEVIIDNLQKKLFGITGTIGNGGDMVEIESQDVKDISGNNWKLNEDNTTTMSLISGSLSFIYLFEDTSNCGKGSGNVIGVNLTDLPDVQDIGIN